MSKKKQGGPKFNSTHGETLNRFEDVPYWESLRKTEPEYESQMKSFMSTQDLAPKRPQRKPLEPELLNQIMDTVNRRKSQIEEYKRENPVPQVSTSHDASLLINEIPTDYRRQREEFNFFSDSYVDKQKERYIRAQMADQLAEDLNRYQDVLKTGIYSESEISEDSPSETFTVSEPSKPKKIEPEVILPRPVVVPKKREVKPAGQVIGPTLTLKLDEEEVRRSRNRRGTSVASSVTSRPQSLSEQFNSEDPKHIYFFLESTQKVRTRDASGSSEDESINFRIPQTSNCNPEPRKSPKPRNDVTIMVEEKIAPEVVYELEKSCFGNSNVNQQKIARTTNTPEDSFTTLTKGHDESEVSIVYENEPSYILKDYSLEYTSSIENFSYAFKTPSVASSISPKCRKSKNALSSLSSKMLQRSYINSHFKKISREEKYTMRKHQPIITLPGEATYPSDDEIFYRKPIIHNQHKSPEKYRLNLKQTNIFHGLKRTNIKRKQAKHVDINKFLTVSQLC